jgi:HAD superfamily phosphatase (TIGR01681 family)
VAPKTVKCLVWDLDDTVWDGVLLEGDRPRPRPGVLGVLPALDSRGILQAVASRGERDVAEAYLRELGLLEYFVDLEVGWGAKSDAVRRVARRLNLGLDTFAFIDNDRSERDEVGGALPQVRCYPHTALAELPMLPEFQPMREVARRSRHAGLRPCAEFTPTAVNRIMLVTLRFAGYTVDTTRPDGSLLLAQDGSAGSSPAADHVRVVAEPRQELAVAEDGR